MTIYFAWVEAGDTTFLPAFEREDEQVFSLTIRQDEGDFALATLEIVNPRLGLLGPGRKRWAWIAYDDGGTAGTVPLFFGRLFGQPAELAGNLVRLELQARPLTYEADKAALAATLRVLPWWDPVWLAPEARDDPAEVLSARNALWHVDRVSHAVTISDLNVGEAGTLALGGPGETTVFYDALSARPLQPPVRKVKVTGAVRWDQAAAGSLDLKARLLQAFRAAGTSDPNRITSYTGEGLERDWPEADTPIGSGWRVGQASLRRLDGSAVVQRFLSVSMPGLPSGALLGTAGGDAEVQFPLWSFAPTLTLAYEAARSRTETLAFTLTADTQDLVTDPGDEEILELELSSFEISEPIDDVGSAGLVAPLIDRRLKSYFLTDRGKASLEHLIALARARLLDRARAVEITLETRLAEALAVTCRHNARVTDPRLPGGEATGKVVAYSLSIDGDSGFQSASLTLGCTVGRGGSVSAAAGTPLYVEEGYVEPGWQAYSGGIVVPIAGEVGYANFDDLGPPNDGLADDGLDFLNMTADRVLLSLEVFNGQAAQEAILAQSYSSLAVAAEALNTVFTEVNFSLVPLETGPFAHEMAVSVTDLVVPKTIDLEAA